MVQCKEILCLTELLMALWEKAFDTRPDLSLIPGTNITERENRLLQVVFGLHVRAIACTHRHNKHIFKSF